MMMPSVFGESLFDDLMDFPFEKEFFGRRNPLYGKHAQNIMKTDIKELEAAYEMDIDLPGFKKEDVSAKLENGAIDIALLNSLSPINNNHYQSKLLRTNSVKLIVSQQHHHSS